MVLVGTPIRWGSSPAITTIDSPIEKPVMTGREMKSVIHPSRAAPASARNRPAEIATAPVRATARAGSDPPASWKTTAPDMMATVDVGPIETCREEPKIRYMISAAGSA